MSFTISTSIPLPALKRIAVSGVSKYNFADIPTGGSLVDTEVVDAKKAAGRLTSAVASYRKRSGDKRIFTVRTFKTEGGTDAVGVWVLPAKEDAAA